MAWRAPGPALHWPEDYAALKAELTKLYGQPDAVETQQMIGEVSVWRLGSRVLRLEQKGKDVKGAAVAFFEPYDPRDGWGD